MQELSGGAPSADAPRRIEAGPGGFDQRPPADADVKPWQRGPTGAAAPWQQRGRGDDHGGYDTRDNAPTGNAAPWARDRGRGEGRGDDFGGQNGYNAAPSGPAAAPWQQAAPAYPPAAPGGYAGYSAPGYGAGYPQANIGAPPGLAAPPGLSGPGLTALLQQFAGSPPPPPPTSSIPPPPPWECTTASPPEWSAPTTPTWKLTGSAFTDVVLSPCLFNVCLAWDTMSSTTYWMPTRVAFSFFFLRNLHLVSLRRPLRT